MAEEEGEMNQAQQNQHGRAQPAGSSEIGGRSSSALCGCFGGGPSPSNGRVAAGGGGVRSCTLPAARRPEEWQELLGRSKTAFEAVLSEAACRPSGEGGQ